MGIGEGRNVGYGRVAAVVASLFLLWRCSDEPPASGACVGPYCAIACDGDSDCPPGSWCQQGECTTENTSGKCVDPDGDGFCDGDCCSGPDCAGGEGNPLIHPGAEEVCDGFDNDCDGRIDKIGCVTDNQGSGTDDPFDPGGGSGLVQNPDGSLTLGTADVATDFAWPSNDAEGTISRIDTILNLEVGRYATVLRVPGANPADPTGIPSVPEWNSGCTRPSRSTVDLNGNAYVANRTHDGGCANQQGSVTKIGFYDHDLCSMSLALCQCIDRNNNGTIETSRDCDGQGIEQTGLCPNGSQPDGIDITNPSEFLAYDDECLIWNVPVGPSDANARAMAIDSYGMIWVGDWQNRKLYQVDPANGQTLDTISVEGRPYGAVVDSNGMLWYVDSYNTGNIQRVDTIGGTVDPLITTNPVGGYGITIDRLDRVWVASFNDHLGGGTVARYSPTSGTWDTFSAGLNGTSWRGRGVTATPAGVTDTGAGVAWVAFHSGAEVHIVAFDDDTGEVWDSADVAQACGARTGIGVGLGSGGNVWVVNQGSDNACRYDPTDSSVVEVQIGNGPYTYSDFTGNILRNFTAPSGTYRTVMEGCSDPGANVVWTMVVWQAGTPGNTSVAVSVRSADTPAGFATATEHSATQPPDRWLELTPFNLSGKLLEVNVTLHGDDDGHVPILFSIEVSRTCFDDPV